ncbi:MAG: hypothetical protein HC795_05445 [Coleofasciculaceae cyanobacterium RL_1_1]|nr:hypothetical protein [Coleofasciculaceae cyanobacterium RL_1_1]
MPFFRQPKIWDIPDSRVTAEPIFLNRRRFLKGSIAGGMGLALLSLSGCKGTSGGADEVGNNPLAGTRPISTRPTALNLPDPGRPVTRAMSPPATTTSTNLVAIKASGEPLNRSPPRTGKCGYMAW